MQQRKLLIGAATLLVGGIGWYLFRPERLFVDAKVNEDFPAVTTGQAASSAHGPDALLTGRFHDAAHKTTGSATIFQLADGKRVLRLTNFETSNGPDVQVYLVAAADAKDNATVTQAGFIHLGALKGNTGDQNYDVPSDSDLSKYRAVTIWCRRFGVNFGTAPLMAENQSASGQPAAVSAGRFHDGAHKTSGMATIYQLADGRRLLRLADFATSNGPDVQVYLVAATDAMDNATVTNAGFLHIGALKGNTGDQNYEVPADADLNKYRAVTIWCRRFGVNFGTAPLQPQMN
jgi:hypothetical protein